MGQLHNGQWIDGSVAARTSADGAFVRPDSPWRDWVSADVGARFQAAAGRYHLYVNMGCPWAWRAVLMRRLKGLEDVIGMTLTVPGMGPQGWTFVPADPGAESTLDTFSGFQHMHEVYSAADAKFTGRVTVPVLWDSVQQTIVNNESADIIRMFNSEFAAFSDSADDYYPEALRAEIDVVNESVYTYVNNGVYRCGFAGSQQAYDKACAALFAELDALENRLSQQRYLVGSQITEADWRLLSTLLRFDLAYYPKFRCNLKRLVDYPNLWAYARDLYQQEGVASVVDWQAFKGIYWSGGDGIIPLGPEDDWEQPHGRG